MLGLSEEGSSALDHLLCMPVLPGSVSDIPKDDQERPFLESHCRSVLTTLSQTDYRSDLAKGSFLCSRACMGDLPQSTHSRPWKLASKPHKSQRTWIKELCHVEQVTDEIGLEGGVIQAVCPPLPVRNHS